MTSYTLPAPDAPAEEWGRLAVSLPGWRWMPGMCNVVPPRRDGPGFASRILDAELTGPPPLTGLPDPDDPATAGCLLALLSPECHRVTTGIEDDESWAWWDGGEWHDSATLGRACIAAAAALGRWPGGTH